MPNPRNHRLSTFIQRKSLQISSRLSRSLRWNAVAREGNGKFWPLRLIHPHRAAICSPTAGESEYSCSGLPPDHPDRYIPASTVRSQARYALRLTLQSKQIQSSDHRSYPHRFHNYPNEGLTLTTTGPWYEFPIRNRAPFQARGDAGVVRVVYPANWRGGDDMWDVIYHDPRKVLVLRGEEVGDFSIAVRQYRPPGQLS